MYGMLCAIQTATVSSLGRHRVIVAAHSVGRHIISTG